MKRLMRPALITLTLAAPAASYALGLGDIHVESALHQPLVAQIELVGVVNDELGRVSAALASDALFQKYNLERAPFIYGTTLSIGRDAQGRPVLNMRSTEKFTEPVVTLLVDMHTPSGELVREYTLFLDPAGLGPNAGAAFNSNSGVAPAADVASNAAAAPNVPLRSKADRNSRSAAQSAATSGTTDNAAAVAPSASSKLLGTKYTVARRDTLARIVTATGAHSRTERHRMMIAIYRANPAAFQNNFNRMHTGVTLTFPTAEQLAAISVDEANREYDAQMAEWRASLHHDASAANRAPAAADDADSSPATSGSTAAEATAGKAAIAANNAREPGAHATGGEPSPSENAVLTQRIASLEQSLAQIQQKLKRPLPVQTPVAATAATASAIAGSLAPASAPHVTAPAVEGNATSEDDEDDSPPAKHHGYQLIAIGAGAGLLFFTGAWFYFRRRNSYAHHMTLRYPLPVAAATEEEVTEDDSSDRVQFSTPPPSLPQSAVQVREPVDAQQPATPEDPRTASSWFEDSFNTPISDLLNDPTVSLGIDDTEKLALESIDPTAKLPKQTPQSTLDTEVLVAPELEFAGDTVEQKFSFFNPEATTNTEHVVMGSALTEPRAFVERRKNPADVLRQAIEREPDRSDLRLKLLELYYTAAAENRRAFLEATRQLAKRETLASPEDWSRIADMGRSIAPDDKLFSSDVDDKRVA
jgi:pilus assembly protein FimV